MENLNLDALRLNLHKMHREIEAQVDTLCNLALEVSQTVAALEAKLAEYEKIPPTPGE